MMPSEELSVRELLDDRAERDSWEERESADDDDHADGQPDEHAVVGSERTEAGRDNVLGCQHPPEGEGWDHDGEAAHQHVDATQDVVERVVAIEASERRAVVVALRGEAIEDL